MKTKSEVLNTIHILSQIDIKSTNPKTAYWIGRNIRKFEDVSKNFETLREKIQKDTWFGEYRSKVEADGEEKAKEEYKDLLASADEEINEYLKEENTIKPYTIKIDDLDIKPELIPYLVDLISE